MKFSSPAFLRSTLGAIALTLSASAMAQSVVRFQDYPGTGNLLVRVAQEQGFCQQAGIRCELRTIPAAPLGMQTMLSGDIEVFFGPTEVAAAAVARKAPISIIAAGFVDPVFFMAAGAKTELATEKEGYPGVVKSFKGKKIGVTQRGSISGDRHAGGCWPDRERRDLCGRGRTRHRFPRPHTRPS
jgi:NitT/TauT family transport system substrate-binding protein